MDANRSLASSLAPLFHLLSFMKMTEHLCVSVASIHHYSHGMRVQAGAQAGG